MQLTYTTRLRVIAIIIVTTVLAQWSVALHACPNLNASSAAHSPACDDVLALPDSERALCQQHCVGDSFADDLKLAVAPPKDSGFRVVPAFRSVGDQAVFIADPARARATSPPLTILYCTSLN